MSVKADARKWLCVVTSHIKCCVYSLKNNEVSFDPLLYCVVLNVNVPRSRCRFTSVCHSCSSVVIFIQDCCCFLRYLEVPHDASYVKTHSPGNCCFRILRFCRRKCDCGQELALPATGPPASWKQTLPVERLVRRQSPHEESI